MSQVQGRPTAQEGGLALGSVEVHVVADRDAAAHALVGYENAYSSLYGLPGISLRPRFFGLLRLKKHLGLVLGLNHSLLDEGNDQESGAVERNSSSAR